jgi:hypothetical protein
MQNNSPFTGFATICGLIGSGFRISCRLSFGDVLIEDLIGSNGLLLKLAAKRGIFEDHWGPKSWKQKNLNLNFFRLL